MKNILFAAAALAAVAAPAYAQEASNFSGFKVGATVGYESVNLSYDDLDDSKGGVLYGLTAGYDYDLGTLVIGVEGEVSDSTVKETATDVLVAGDRWKLSAGRDLYVGARLGFPVSHNLMLYAEGGYTNARAKLSVSDGYRVGGGIEFANPGHFARLEYRYSDYGNYSYDGFNTGIAASRHQIAVTGGFRF